MENKPEDSRADGVGELLSKQKISRAMAKDDSFECFVDGPSVGMGHGPVPCVLSSVAGQTAKVVIADGHETGVEISVPLSKVDVMGSAKMEQAAKALFRSE